MVAQILNQIIESLLIDFVYVKDKPQLTCHFSNFQI